MIYYYAVSQVGKVEGGFYSTDPISQLDSFSSGCVAIESELDIFAMNPGKFIYYDPGLSDFVALDKPAGYMVFDYVAKQWSDSRTLDEIKAQKWSEIKSQRNQLEIGGFEFEGNGYDSDQVSQGRIMGAAVAGVDQTWTLANNTTVELTASQLQQLYAALQAHIASVHERGRIARQLIFEAETKEEVEGVEL